MNEPEFVVVINDEEQYSIWPAAKDMPRGWRQIGDSRSREACLTYIEEHWTDMRPRSMRRQVSDG